MANREAGLWSDMDLRESVDQGRVADPDGYKIVSVRLREAEYLSFAEHASAAGLTNNMALRIAARRIAGFLEVDRDTRHTLQEVSRNIGQIAASLAALRRIAQEDGTLNMKVLTEQRIAFGKEFSTLDSLLQRVLNVSKRRRDGRAMLLDATQQ
ncbi:DNA mobilization endonuclease VirD1/MobC family subunit [Rhizobium puerariae]|uniref:DNA mobilization endonuclease VirD1/MobC family subunit n=1 Tax=Rhizobium puerariae TaxID=1585791 RepID=A0ABV6AMM1_9HYPH